jgi:hypothetical protein
MKTLPFVVLASTFALMAAGCPGEEGEVCFEDGDCSSGLVCCKTTASATARGRCYPTTESCSVAPRPDASTDTGVDGATDSAVDAPADAPADSTPMDATMPCDPTADECGMGYCRVANCGDSMGECVERPLRCDGVLEPVCGCDGRTYTSDCEAGRSGMSVDYEGSCGSPPDTGVMDAGSDASDAASSG